MMMWHEIAPPRALTEREHRDLRKTLETIYDAIEALPEEERKVAYLEIDELCTRFELLAYRNYMERVAQIDFEVPEEERPAEHEIAFQDFLCAIIRARKSALRIWRERRAGTAPVPFLTLAEAAEIMGCSEPFLQCWIRAGRLPISPNGLIERSELYRFAQSIGWLLFTADPI